MAGVKNTKTKSLDDRIDACVDKPTSATTGNLAKFDADDNIEDAGVATETTLSPASDAKVPTSKAIATYAQPIPAAATDGNLAKFNASKEAVDSGVAPETTMTSGDAKVPTTGAVKKVTDPLVTWVKNHVVDGGKGADGSTASVHDEAVPSHDFNTDISECVAIVNNVMGTLAAVVDGDLTSDGAADPLGAVNDTLFCSAVIAEAAGSLAYVYVEGTAAPAISAVTPTDGDITTAVGHANWIRVCDYKFTRTGAATLTLTLYNDVKPVLG